MDVALAIKELILTSEGEYFLYKIVAKLSGLKDNLQAGLLYLVEDSTIYF